MTNHNYPRIGVLKNFFDEVALGEKGVPQKECITDNDTIKNNPELNNFCQIHKFTQGKFTKHYYASIPYRLEEDIRAGVAILNYLFDKNDNCSLYSLGTADATLARTIGILGKGRIKTFSCTPTKANVLEFNKNGIPTNSYLHVAPFYEITLDLLSKQYKFNDLFDFIYEDTTFQMYSKARYKQIAHLKTKLKKNGIMGFVEKFSADNIEEYMYREYQKDNLFKIIYFSNKEIKNKKDQVLTYMNNGQVTISEFTTALLKIFQYAIITWNSGNFYSIYASDSKDNLIKFLNKMSKPLIPEEYVYKKLPTPLVGFSNIDIEKVIWSD